MANNCPQKTISSDITGLSYAREKCINELPDLPVWKALEPNSIDSYGATVTTATRTPIGAGRQRIKGDMTDLEAAAGYTSDLTSNSHQEFIEGFLLSDPVKLNGTKNEVGATKTIVGVTATGVQLTAGATKAFSAGELVMLSGFANPLNNRVHTVASYAANTITFVDPTGALEASAPVGAAVVSCGHKLAAGDAAIVLDGTRMRLNATGVGGKLSANVRQGDWLFLSGLKGYTGFARLGATPSGDFLVFDRVLGTAKADDGTGSTLSIYTSMSIRNPDKYEDMKFHSYQFEQTLGSDKDGTQARYVTGAMANEFTLTVPSADKVTAQFAFVACDEETRTGVEGLKVGTRPPLETYPMFNASKSANKVWLHVAGEAEPLFAYATNATVTINNNMSGVKAIGVEGNLDINIGTFEVGGAVTAYFLDLRAVRAIRENADVGGTVALVGNNVGVIFDMPKMGLSNGQTSIEPNTPVTIALDMAAVRNDLGYTLQYAYFPYLPTIK